MATPSGESSALGFETAGSELSIVLGRRKPKKVPPDSGGAHVTVFEPRSSSRLRTP